MSASTLSDQELAGRIARGDPAALREGWRRASGRASAITWRILRSRVELDESLQETFIEVWRRARTFDACKGDFVSWVATIARSRAIDRVRAVASARRREEGAAIVQGGAGPAPLEGALRGERNRHLRTAVEILPAEQRSVIELAYFEGLTLRAVAERTRVPLGTVKTRARLALQKLGGVLGESDFARADD